MDVEEIAVLDPEDNRNLKVTHQGVVYILKTADPYGLWTIHPEKGRVAAVLAGFYTTSTKAMSAIEGYHNLKAPKGGEDS